MSLVMAAAVADWRPDIAANSKIKKCTDRVRAADQAGGKSRHPGDPGAAARSGRAW